MIVMTSKTGSTHTTDNANVIDFLVSIGWTVTSGTTVETVTTNAPMPCPSTEGEWDAMFS